jgi:hypothetical protein
LFSGLRFISALLRGVSWHRKTDGAQGVADSHHTFRFAGDCEQAVKSRELLP